MKIRIFTVPAFHGTEQEKDLNQFLAGHRIVSVDKHFIDAGMNSAWSVCVTWTESKDAMPIRKGQIDYKEVLNEGEFSIYAVLRELRKKLAEQEGVPPYALFTNEQLAEMVRRQTKSKAEMAGIKGIGEARIKKYGDAFLRALAKTRQSEKTENSDAAQPDKSDGHS